MFDLEELKKHVLREAEKLRELATAEERSNLDFEYLEPTDGHCCIYGQMTGVCHSDRAIVLIRKTSPAFYTNLGYDVFERDGSKPRKRLFSSSNGRRNFSAIELYITLPEAKNRELIAYLKGETDALEL